MSSNDTDPADLSLDKPTLDPDTFDIDAWISGSTKPQRAVEIFQDGAAFADFQQAHAEFNHLSQQRAQRTDNPDEDAALGDEDALDEQLLAVVDRMDDAYRRAHDKKVTLRFEANATGADFRALMSKYEKERQTDEMYAYYHLAAKCFIGPKTAASSWKKLRRSIGDGQWSKIVKAIDGACLNEDVTPDFSVPLSLLRPTKPSSES